MHDFFRAATAVVTSVLLLVVGGIPPTTLAAERPEVCFIIYMMADNDLEPSIYNDYAELYLSTAVDESNLHTWLYFDAAEVYDYDLDGNFDGTPDSPYWFMGLMESDGVTPYGTAGGSLYLTYNKPNQVMTVEKVIEGEVNSDDPETLCDFVTHALTDCVSKGATEYFVVFSSHGGGYAGFGGDDYPGGRRLMQSNELIVGGLECALDATPNSPDTFDVIGFDACIMMSYFAAYEYSLLTKYYLASELLEPLHGWAYDQLTNTDSALDMALQLQDTFLTSLGTGYDQHQTPKALAIVETVAFEAFLEAFEDLASDLTDRLYASDDADLSAAIQRVRAKAVTHDGYVDNPGSRDPSLVDIGSFLSLLNTMCIPSQSSSLGVALENAAARYNDMYVAQGVGPGTSSSFTGMHVLWPSKRYYRQDSDTIEDELALLDDGSTSYPWINFFDAYILSMAPTTTSQSVCTKNLVSTVEQTYEGQMLLSPEVFDTGEEIVATSEITLSCDVVISEYGWVYDSTFINEMGRYLTEDARSKRSKNVLSPVGKRLQRSRGDRSSETAPSVRQHHRRRLQEEESYVIFLGGSLENEYDGPTYTATWNRLTHVLTDGNSITVLSYTDNLGDGAMSIPVLYFPKEISVTLETVETMDLDIAQQLGAVFGDLQFTVDSNGNMTSPITLYTNSGGGTTGAISETPQSAGGSVVPIVFAEEGYEDGSFNLVEFAGYELYDWGSSEIIAYPVDLDKFAETMDFDTIVIDMYAYDLDKEPEEEGYFDLALFDLDLFSDQEEINFEPGAEVTGNGQPTVQPNSGGTLVDTNVGESDPLVSDATSGGCYFCIHLRAILALAGTYNFLNTYILD